MKAPSPVFPRVRTLALLGVVAALVLPSASMAGGSNDRFALERVAGAPSRPVPENYQARLDPAGEAAKVGSPLRRSEISARERGAEAALAARVPDLHISRDELTLYPVQVLSYKPGTMLGSPSKAAARSPEDAARQFLSANKGVYGMSEEDLASLRVRYVTSPEGGATIVKFDQYIDELPVFGEDVSVVMTQANEIAGTSGRMYPQVAAGEGARSRFALPATEVIAQAVRDLTGRVVAPADFDVVNADAGGGYRVYGYTPDRTAGTAKFLSTDTRVREVLFPMAAGVFLPGYYLELWVEGDPGGSGPVFSYVIDAEGGWLLFRNNLTQKDSYGYRVYADGSGDYRPWDGPTGTIGTPHPTGTPNGYQAPFINAPLITIESLLGPADPWLPPGATATTGNNTDAYLDLALPNGFGAGDLRGATTAPNTFDYQYDSTQNCEVPLNRQAAVVGMFYQVNWLHDIWYRHGFTEAAGNGQTNNFGRGGLGNDPVLAEGQDRSGTDNANMATPADGGSPRMQMFKFLAGGRLNPTRDGTFDMLIVGHEMGHYISNRLIGNSSGLGNRQGGSMGEGWGDFICLLTTAQDTDNLEGTTFAVGGQTDIFWCGASFVDNYYYSIRRYPYSSSKLKNPFTFKDIGPGITTYPGVSGDPCTNLTSNPSEVHNSGEIWSQIQWEAFAGLARAYGTATAREKMLQYMIDGMKAMPSQPTFTEARDGYIVAANAANGFANAKDTQILWKAFANRGIGTSAISPIRNSTTHAGVVEDFTAAPGLPDDTVGIYSGGFFFERDVIFGGGADQTFGFGAGGLRPLVGNWDGGAGVGPASADTPGLYDMATGTFFLRNSNTPGPADLTFAFGAPGAIPIVGDWDGNGSTTVGIYVPATGAFFLSNTNAAGPADTVFIFGAAGAGLIPIAGDWNNDGVDTVGLYNPATGSFFLTNTNGGGPASITFAFGAPGGVPLAGDWNSDGVDTIAVYVPSTGVFFFRNSNASGVADDAIAFGPANVALPVAGNFDGQ
jgi:extracellular elastinolytic metalloproteinase